MKKNAFLTFIFACIPGAGQMYYGYMKRNMFDGMQLTINSGLAQLADPVVPRSNPTNNGGSPAHGE